jgi:hypothetical protein
MKAQSSLKLIAILVCSFLSSIAVADCGGGCSSGACDRSIETSSTCADPGCYGRGDDPSLSGARCCEYFGNIGDVNEVSFDLYGVQKDGDEEQFDSVNYQDYRGGDDQFVQNDYNPDGPRYK